MRAASYVLATALFGCTTTPQRPIPVLTPVELIAQAEQMVGRRVQVTGYFTFQTDTRALWQSRDAYQDAAGRRRGPGFNYWTQCITVYWRRLDLRGYHGRYVAFTGTVEIVPEDSLRGMWTCNAVAIHVVAARFR